MKIIYLMKMTLAQKQHSCIYIGSRAPDNVRMFVYGIPKLEIPDKTPRQNPTAAKPQYTTWSHFLVMQYIDE